MLNNLVKKNIPKELKERYAGVAGAESGRGGGEAINQITINFTITAVASLKLCFHFGVLLFLVSGVYKKGKSLFIEND